MPDTSEAPRAVCRKRLTDLGSPGHPRVYACTLLPGHDGPHQDADGLAWTGVRDRGDGVLEPYTAPATAGA